MKIYFSSTGVETSRDSTGDNFVYGNNNVNYINTFWQDRVLTNYVKTIVFKRPDNTTTNELVMTNSVDGSYAFFKVAKSVINQAGTYAVTVKLKQATSGGSYDTQCTSQFNLVVANGVAASDDTNITSAEYESMSSAITSESNTRANADTAIKGAAAQYDSLEINYNNATHEVKVGIGYLTDPDDTYDDSITLPVASASADGLMVKADKAFIDGIQNGTNNINVGNINARNIVADTIKNTDIESCGFNGTNTNSGVIQGGEFKDSQLKNSVLFNATISQQNATGAGVAKLQNITDAKTELNGNIATALQTAKTYTETYHTAQAGEHLVGATLNYNSDTHQISLTFTRANQQTFNTSVIDLPLESMISNVEQVENGKLKITLQNGTIRYIDLYDLLSGFATDAELDTLSDEWTTYKNTMNTAENARVNAENARVLAETARGNAETDRGTRENARINNEANRVLAETARVNAESARVTAEGNRTTAFNNKLGDMQSAINTFNTNSGAAITTFNTNGAAAIAEFNLETRITNQEILDMWGNL